MDILAQYVNLKTAFVICLLSLVILYNGQSYNSKRRLILVFRVIKCVVSHIFQDFPFNSCLVLGLLKLSFFLFVCLFRNVS